MNYQMSNTMNYTMQVTQSTLRSIMTGHFFQAVRENEYDYPQ